MSSAPTLKHDYINQLHFFIKTNPKACLHSLLEVKFTFTIILSSSFNSLRRYEGFKYNVKIYKTTMIHVGKDKSCVSQYISEKELLMAFSLNKTNPDTQSIPIEGCSPLKEGNSRGKHL